MAEESHCIDFLKQETLELWILDHFLLGNTLDCVARGGRRGLGDQQHMPETSLPQPTDGVVPVIIQNRLSLSLLSALQHTYFINN